MKRIAVFKIATIIGAVGLAGCVQTRELAPEVQALVAACEAGNLNACAAAAQARERARANDIEEARLLWE